MKTTNSPILRPFEVLIPTPEGDAVAERVQINVPMEWDEELGEFLLTEEAHRLIEDTKARHLGLMSIDEIKALRMRHGLSQRQMSELLQAGEKSYTRWETGAARPSRMVNLMLRAIDEGKITVDWLRAQQHRGFSWSKVVCHNFQQTRSAQAAVKFTLWGNEPPRLPLCDQNDETVPAAA